MLEPGIIASRLVLPFRDGRMLYNVSHRGLTPAPAGPGPRPSVVSTEVQGSGVGVGGVNVHFILLGFHYGLHHRHCGGRRQRALRLRSGVSLTRFPLGVWWWAAWAPPEYSVHAHGAGSHPQFPVSQLGDLCGVIHRVGPLCGITLLA